MMMMMMMNIQIKKIKTATNGRSFSNFYTDQFGKREKITMYNICKRSFRAVLGFVRCDAHQEAKARSPNWREIPK